MELSKIRDELTTNVKTLAETTEQLQQRTDDAEQRTRQRDAELDRERQQTQDIRRTRDESEAHIELLQRRLEEEQAKRNAAEKKLEAIHATDVSGPMNAPIVPRPLALTSSRLGRYQELATVLGHDVATDHLFELMHEEVEVAADYADWRVIHGGRIAARRHDPNQSLDERAYAAALAARWHLVDHPHVRLAIQPQWRQRGCLLDEKSERYLLLVTHERVAEMKSGRRLAAVANKRLTFGAGSG